MYVGGRGGAFMCLGVCVLPGAELGWSAAEANHWYLQGGGP